MPDQGEVTPKQLTSQETLNLLSDIYEVEESFWFKNNWEFFSGLDPKVGFERASVACRLTTSWEALEEAQDWHNRLEEGRRRLIVAVFRFQIDNPDSVLPVSDQELVSANSGPVMDRIAKVSDLSDRILGETTYTWKDIYEPPAKPVNPVEALTLCDMVLRARQEYSEAQSWEPPITDESLFDPTLTPQESFQKAKERCIMAYGPFERRESQNDVYLLEKRARDELLVALFAANMERPDVELPITNKKLFDAMSRKVHDACYSALQYGGLGYIVMRTTSQNIHSIYTND